MFMRFLLVLTLIFTSIVSKFIFLTNSSAQNAQYSPSEQLSEVMMLSMRLLDQFAIKFPSMRYTFMEMHRGIQNFYALGLTDEQLTGQSLKIQQIDKMLLALPSSTVSKAQYSKLIQLFGFLSKLRTIFPGNLNEFNLSMRTHGSPGTMVEAAYPPLYSILYNLNPPKN